MIFDFDYESILQRAEEDDPHCMLEYAKLIKSGFFGDIDYDEYVYWLKQFFNTPIIQQITKELDEQYSPDESEENPIDDIFSEDFLTHVYDDQIAYKIALRSDIIEAGMALGIYFSNSSQKEELELSVFSLIDALNASAGDFLVEAKEDILSILERIDKRFKDLGFQCGEIHE